MVDQVTLVDGSVITDDTNSTTGIRAGGHRNWFIKALQSLSIWASQAQSYAAQAQAAAGAGGGTIFPVITSVDAGKTLAISQNGSAFGLVGNHASALILNCNFDVWQAGTTFSNPTSISNMYAPDGWYFYRTGWISGITCSKSVNGCKIQRTAGDTNITPLLLAQSFETIDVKKYAGKMVSIQFKALKGANFSGANLTLKLIYGTGTDSSTASVFTGQAVAGSQNFTLTTTLSTYTATISIPTNATQLAVEISYAPSSTALADDSFTVDDVYLNEGTVPLLFPLIHYQDNLMRCQRYYQSTGAMISGGYAAAAGHVYNSYILPVIMRATPSISFGTPSYANASGLTSWNAESGRVSTDIIITAAGYGYSQHSLILDARLK